MTEIAAHIISMIEKLCGGLIGLHDSMPQAGGLAATANMLKADLVKLREMTNPPAPADDRDDEHVPAPGHAAPSVHEKEDGEPDKPAAKAEAKTEAPKPAQPKPAYKPYEPPPKKK